MDDEKQLDSGVQYEVGAVPFHTHNGTDSPLISNSGSVNKVSAGSGISISPGTGTGNVTVTNTGILSLSAGTAIGVSGSTISNVGVTKLSAGTNIVLTPGNGTGVVTISVGSLATTGLAFDNSTVSPQNPGSVTSTTITHTATGSNLIAMISTFIQDGDWLTSLQYSGLTPTLIDKQNVPTTNGYIYSHYVIGAPSGNSNVIASVGTSTIMWVACETYTGAKQSGQPDAFASGTGTGLATLSQSVVTIADKTWLHGSFAAGANNAGSAPSAGANTNMREGFILIGTGANRWRTVSTDTNAQETPAGSYAQNVNTGFSSLNGAWVVSSIAPL